MSTHTEDSIEEITDNDSKFLTKSSRQSSIRLPDNYKTSIGDDFIPYEILSIQGEIGTGQFGKVHKALYTEEVVAVKRLGLNKGIEEYSPFAYEVIPLFSEFNHL